MQMNFILEIYFDAIADGNQITKSKPNPEVFLLAANNKLKVIPENCFVVEDADAGVEAALAGNMKYWLLDLHQIIEGLR